jgi:hypothetical protein
MFAFPLQHLLLVTLMMTPKWLSLRYSGIWNFVIIYESNIPILSDQIMLVKAMREFFCLKGSRLGKMKLVQ